MSFKSYCLTVFPPTDSDVDFFIQELTVWATDHTNRFLAGREICPRTGRLHLQCVLTLKKNARIPQLAKLLQRFNKPHIEPCKNMPQSLEYCRKEGDVVIDYTVTRQGHRTDLDDAIAALKEGGLRKVAEDFPHSLVKFSTGFRFLSSFMRSPIDREVKAYIFIGPPGTGKSRAANTYPKPYRPAIVHGHSPWFDGYEDHSTLILDDFSGEWSCGWLKQLLDRYALQLPVKGGFVPALFSTVIITSNTQPCEWWPKATPDDLAAINRRVVMVEQPPYPIFSNEPEPRLRSPVSTPLDTLN